MKKSIKIIAFVLTVFMFMTALVSCDSKKADKEAMAKVAGKYEANTHLERDWELGDSGKKVKIKHDLRAEIILDENGVYTYNCYNVDMGTEFECHYQKGRYGLVENEITFIPSEHWVKGEKGGVWKLSEMTAEESEKWTVKGIIE